MPHLPTVLRPSAVTRPGDDRGVLPPWAGAAGLVVVFLLSIFSLSMTPRGSDIAVFWPAAGISLAILAFSSRRQRRWLLVGIAAATTASSLWVDRPVQVALIFGLAVALGSVTAVAVVTGGGRIVPRLRTLEDLFRLLVAAGVGAVVHGVILGATVELMLTDSGLVIARTVAAATMAAYLLLLPPILLLADARMRRQEHRLGEATIQVTLMLAVAAVVFFPADHVPMAFATVPLLVWAGLRLSVLVCAVETLLLAVLATVLTFVEIGPFGVLIGDGRASWQGAAALLQLYVAVLVLVAVSLALVSAARREAVAEAEEGRELYRRAMDESVIGMMLLRPTPEGLLVTDVNDPAAHVLGRSAQDLCGQVWQDRLGPDELFLLREIAAELERGHSGSLTREVQLLGEPHTCVRLSLSWRDRGATGGLVTAQLVDVTEMKLSRAELSRERDFTTAVLNSADALILVLDRHQVVHRVNQAVERLVLGRPRTVVGQPLWNTGLTPACVDELRRVLATPGWQGRERHQLGEHEWQTGQGSRRVFSWTCSPLADGEAELGVVLTGIDVTPQRDAQALFEQVFTATTGTSIIGTDASGTITFFNPGAERLLGYAAEEVVGTCTPMLFLDPAELEARAAEAGEEPSLQIVTRAVLESGQPDRRDWTHIHKDGRRLTVSLTIAAMPGPGGPAGFVGVGEDVTERRAAEAALERALAHERRAVEQLHELDQQKNEFVASVSHELRTPMTSVLGFCQLLLNGSGGDLSDRQRTLLGRVSRNARRLLSLIEDLLTVSRFDTEGVDLEPVETDLVELVALAVESMEDVLRGRDLELSLPEQDGRFWHVHADRDQVERALVNLLSNAVKFTPDGGRVSVQLDTAGADAVVLTVADTGVGVPHEERDRIFERFYRASTARRSAIPGTGLGLNIVRAIVEAHGGAIEVESEVGAGSRFVVTLPRGRAAALRVISSDHA